MTVAEGIFRVRASPISGLLILGLSLVGVLLASACGGESDAALQVADVAPDFTLTATDGTTVSLSDHVGSKSVLLYFSMGYG